MGLTGAETFHPTKKIKIAVPWILWDRTYPSLKLTARTWNRPSQKGNWYSDHPFSGAMLVSGKVVISPHSKSLVTGPGPTFRRPSPVSDQGTAVPGASAVGCSSSTSWSLGSFLKNNWGPKSLIVINRVKSPQWNLKPHSGHKLAAVYNWIRGPPCRFILSPFRCCSFGSFPDRGSRW